jgi:tryptophan synthase alpha chain
VSKIDRTFDALKNRGQSALIPFIMAGDPDLETTEVLVSKMVEAGADIVELGVPFSDPLADGPTIQSASQRALRNGTNLKEILYLTERLKGITVPLVLMTYFNPVFKYGLKEFAEDCQKSGVSGVIIPDLPPEEAGPWVEEARRARLDTIFLIAPTSSPERIKVVSRCSRGFIYYVSVTGVTGTRERLPEELELTVKGIKEQTRKRVAVGFGISTPEQAKGISHFADGVIIGSAIVKMIEENLTNPELPDRVGDFVTSLAKALKSSPPSAPL